MKIWTHLYLPPRLVYLMPKQFNSKSDWLTSLSHGPLSDHPIPEKKWISLAFLDHQTRVKREWDFVGLKDLNSLPHKKKVKR